MHRSCIEECPEDCEQQWETYEEWNSPFEVDNTMTVTCGTNYLVRYICVLTAHNNQSSIVAKNPHLSTFFIKL